MGFFKHHIHSYIKICSKPLTRFNFLGWSTTWEYLKGDIKWVLSKKIDDIKQVSSVKILVNTPLQREYVWQLTTYLHELTFFMLSKRHGLLNFTDLAHDLLCLINSVQDVVVCTHLLVNPVCMWQYTEHGTISITPYQILL